MIALGLRLALRSGRESLVRLTLTTIGVALGVLLLLFAAAAIPALHAHDVRRGWMSTTTVNRRPLQDETATDGLLWHVGQDRYVSHDIVRVDVAVEGPHPPLPPGVVRLPGPNEIVVSPAMARLLASTDTTVLGDRYPGKVIGLVGRAALDAPSALVVFVGHRPDELHTAAVIEVHSIESAPIDHGFTVFLRVVLVLGALGLLVPIVVFVSTATRLAAARREQRVTALRLAGATPGQTMVVALVEAAVATIAASALGLIGFIATRSAAARVPVDGAAFYPSDLRLPAGWAALILAGVPALAMTITALSLRRVRISPLGVSKRLRRTTPRPRRVLLIVAGAALLAVTVASATSATSRASRSTPIAVYLIGVAFVAIIVGIVLIGPWLTTLVSRLLDRFGQRAPSMLAARRLGADPATAFRAISGVALAVFVATVIGVLAAASRTTAGDNGTATAVAQSTVVTAWGDVDHRGADPADVAAVVAELTNTAGVTRTVSIAALPTGTGIDTSGYPDASVRPGVIDCRDATTIGLPACTGTTVVNLASYIYQKGNISSIELETPIPAATLARLPVAAISVFTTGRASVIERVRTILEAANTTGPTLTGADIGHRNRQQIHTINQLSDVGLAATLLIAGCSLAVAVAAGIVERTRPFALLRLSGMQRTDLHRTVLTESAGPLLIVTLASAASGQLVAALVLIAAGRANTYQPPPLNYWISLGAGLTLALLVVAATLPLLDHLTALDNVRFE